MLPTSEVPHRKALWLEVAALVGFLLLPKLVPTIALLPQLRSFVGSPYLNPFHPRNPWLNVERSLAYVAIILPVVFIVWSSGEGWKAFGLRRWRMLPDLLIAALLGALLLAVQYFPKRILWRDQLTPEIVSILVPHGLAAGASIVLVASVGALFEELFFRGYLISRLEELTGNVWIGVVISAFFFCFGHLYEGMLPAALTLGMGLAFGIAFVGRRSIWPLVLAHATYNLAVTYWI